MGDDPAQLANAFSVKLRKFLPNSAELLTRFLRGQRTFGPREEVVAGGGSTVFVMCVGWASAYRLMADGNRQIIDFRLPGDFLGLIGMLVGGTEVTLETVTDTVAWELDRNGLMAAMRDNQRLTEAVLWSLSRDAAIVAERLVSIGRRDAVSRTAHLLLELGYRLNQVGEAQMDSYHCPLIQKDLAEALGITNVHMNRVLRYLRQEDLASLNGKTVTLHNPKALRHLAAFDAAYLGETGTPT
jgi:CRP-like cAMP-binding protein